MADRVISLDSMNFYGREVAPNRASEIRDAVLGVIPEGLHGDERLLDIVYGAGQLAVKDGLDPSAAALLARHEIELRLSAGSGMNPVDEAEQIITDHQPATSSS